MIRPLRRVRAAAAGVAVAVLGLSLAGVLVFAAGCDDTPDPVTKLPGTWQVGDLSVASSSAKFMFSQTALDLHANKSFRIRPRVHGPNDALMTFDGNWRLDGSTLTLSISGAPEQLAMSAAGKVMTLELNPAVDQLTLTSQGGKLVFEKTR